MNYHRRNLRSLASAMAHLAHRRSSYAFRLRGLSSRAGLPKTWLRLNTVWMPCLEARGLKAVMWIGFSSPAAHPLYPRCGASLSAALVRIGSAAVTNLRRWPRDLRYAARQPAAKHKTERKHHSIHTVAALSIWGITARIRPPLCSALSSLTVPRYGNWKTRRPALAGKETATFSSGICFATFSASRPLKLAKNM